MENRKTGTVNECALQVLNLNKSYGQGLARRLVLDNVSFEVRSGESFAFLGPNGSGKTTTINIISGVVAEDAGRVSLYGRRPGEKDYLRDVAFLSGDSDFMWSMSGARILSFYRDLHGSSTSLMKSLIERFGMGTRISRTWGMFSNGEKTRLRLIKALMRSPKLLFLDEPTVGLDPEAAQFLREELVRLNREGLTIVITSHDMKDIEYVARRVCFIHHGRVVFDGAPEDGIHAQGLTDFYIDLVRSEKEM
jgi:ABC-2 type transport system ATP-binding protein